MNKKAFNIVQRGHVFAYLETQDGSWNFPAVIVGSEEAAEDAAQRAALEHAGLKTMITTHLGSPVLGETNLLYFLSSSARGDITLSDEFKRAIWATPEFILNTQQDNIPLGAQALLKSIVNCKIAHELGYE